MTRLLAIAGICASLALAACGDDDSESASDSASEPTAAAEDAAAEKDAGSGGAGPGSAGGDAADGKPGITIATGDSQFGTILFDGSERAIYLFGKEQADASECYDACAEAWPPVLTEAEPQADGGIDGKLLGTTERDDGTTQVTYNGHPLYYYVDDPPGEVLCHDVVEFGGLWLVVDPSGDAVQ
jgi:predicted lipoprotein with Yx(FWY)xxD motif